MGRLLTGARAAALAVGAGLLPLSLPLGAAAAAPASSLGDATYVSFAGPTLQLVSEQDLTTDCTRLYRTTDLVHFTDVTPHVWRLPVRDGGPCAWGAYQADFVTRQVGWVLSRDLGSDTTVLAHTTDGGRSWSRETGSTTGSNGGSEAIGFLTPLDGWRQQVAMGSNAPFLLQHTSDAGATWADVVQHGGCQYDVETFSTTTIGFATSRAPSAFRTTDGGATWHPFALRRPRVIPARDPALYGRPQFTGRLGTMPVTYLSPAAQDVAFFVTDDAGRSWRVDGVAVVREGTALRGPLGCPGPPQVTSPLALTSASTPATWWVLQHRAVGTTVVLTVQVRPTGGVRVVGHLARGLPHRISAGEYEALFAAGARTALLELSSGNTRTYVTTDGGAAWHVLTTGSP